MTTNPYTYCTDVCAKVACTHIPSCFLSEFQLNFFLQCFSFFCFSLFTTCRFNIIWWQIHRGTFLVNGNVSALIPMDQLNENIVNAQSQQCVWELICSLIKDHHSHACFEPAYKIKHFCDVHYSTPAKHDPSCSAGTTMPESLKDNFASSSLNDLSDKWVIWP